MFEKFIFPVKLQFLNYILQKKKMGKKWIDNNLIVKRYWGILKVQLK